jgi:hypothetical protein
MSSTLQNTTKTMQHHTDDVVFDPSEYLAYKRSTDPSRSAPKRQRLDDLPTTVQPSMSTPLMSDQLGSSISSAMLTPISMVSQGSRASNYHLSPCSSFDSSFYGSEDMSRQGSSLSSTSMTEGFGMLRVASSGSSSFNVPFPISLDEQQEDFPFLSVSIPSSMPEKPSSALQATTGVEDVTLQQSDLFRDMGSGFDHGSISFAPFDFHRENEMMATGMPWQMVAPRTNDSTTVAMKRTESQISTSTDPSISSTMSQHKAAARRQKQIANGASQPLRPKVAVSDNKATPKAITAQKQPIPRLPSHPKTKTPLSCADCSITLRGPHERQRHWDNVHAPVKRVWICVQPKQSPFKPKKGLDICKQCKQGKQYNVYYNAAAHLRRGHFCPSKRGRRPRGEAGTSALNLSVERSKGPSIDEMKAHGWLKEISVPNNGQHVAADDDNDVADTTDFDDEHDGEIHPQGRTIRIDSLVPDITFNNSQLMSYNTSTSSLDHPNQQYQQTIDPQQEAICLQTLGLQPLGFLPFEEVYDQNNMIIPTGHAHNTWTSKAVGAAPLMEHSFSAPGRMATRW